MKQVAEPSLIVRCFVLVEGLILTSIEADAEGSVDEVDVVGMSGSRVCSSKGSDLLDWIVFVQVSVAYPLRKEELPLRDAFKCVSHF